MDFFADDRAMDIALARTLHLLGVVVWVGGMFFANFALRPSVTALPPPQRLPLLVATLGRFMAWAGAAVIAVVASGFWLVGVSGGMAGVSASVHAMMGIGIAMAAVYLYVIAVPFRAMRAAVARADWTAGGAAMARVRLLVAVNLALGLVTVVLGAFAR
jgi:uncharacterized membrane protein